MNATFSHCSQPIFWDSYPLTSACEGINEARWYKYMGHGLEISAKGQNSNRRTNLGICDEMRRRGAK